MPGGGRPLSSSFGVPHTPKSPRVRYALPGGRAGGARSRGEAGRAGPPAAAVAARSDAVAAPPRLPRLEETAGRSTRAGQAAALAFGASRPLPQGAVASNTSRPSASRSGVVRLVMVALNQKGGGPHKSAFASKNWCFLPSRGRGRPLASRPHAPVGRAMSRACNCSRPERAWRPDPSRNRGRASRSAAMQSVWSAGRAREYGLQGGRATDRA